MDSISGLLTNYIKMSPHELENALNTIAFIHQEGIGSIHFDKIVKLKFGEKEEDYIHKLHKALRDEPENIAHLSESLIDWYNSWHQTFKKFDSTSAKNYFQERPSHTWLYCLMTGGNEIYQNMVGEEIVTLGKSRYEELLAQEKKKSVAISNSYEQPNPQNELMKKMEALYKKDRNVRLKVLLMNKKIAIYHGSSWNHTAIENLKYEYYFDTIDQYSAVEKPKSIGEYDYYLMVTSRAAHSTKNVLESKIDNERIFFVDADNIDRVMEQFIFQLEGKI